MDEAPPQARDRRSGRLVVVAGIGATLIAAGVAVAFRKGPPAAIAGPRRSLAVFGLRGDCGATAEELLRADLATSSALRVAAPGLVTRARLELGLLGAGPPEARDLERLGRDLGVALSIDGTCETSDHRLAIALRAVDTASGAVPASTSGHGAPGELPTLVRAAALELRRELRSPPPAALPPLFSSAAAGPWAEGEARLRRGDASGAVASLERAVAADPRDPRPRAALAEALRAAGQPARAREEARAAAPAAASFPRDEKLAVEARAHLAAGEVAQAIALMRARHELLPDDLDLAEALVQAMGREERFSEGRAAIARLRRLPPPAGEDPRLDALEMDLAARAGAVDEARSLARRLREKAAARGASLLAARASLLEGQLLRRGGDRPGAIARAVEAFAIFAAAGDARGAAQALAVAASRLE